MIICTRNRAESLRLTLECLARAEQGTLRCEVVVVDNGGSDHTAEVARSFSASFPVHLLCEPTPGKGYALNRALAEAPLGGIVAVLDDDMSPHADWFLGVKAICDRWPEHDWFTGRSYVIWPEGNIPDWCHRPGFRGWAFSVMDAGPRDKAAPVGRWFSGNHFWFRSRVLVGGRRFEVGQTDLRTHIEMSEPQFMLLLAEEGRDGISAPDAVCGHRVQRDLLTVDAMEKRAARAGRGFGSVWLRPYKRRIKPARLLRRHPLLGRLYCVGSIIGWNFVRMMAGFHLSRAISFERYCYAIQRLATYNEYLRIARQMDDYRVLAKR